MRINQIQKIMQELDWLIVSNPKSIEYFSGDLYFCGERLLALAIPKEGKATLFINRMFPVNKKSDLDYVQFDDTEDSALILAQYLLEGKVGVDHEFPSGFLLRMTSANWKLKFSLASDLINRCRSIKDEVEQQYMRKSSLINDAVMAKVRGLLKVGVSEVQVQSQLASLFQSEDPEAVSYGGIIAFGANAADPHGVSGDRILREGQSIVIDMGCRYRGYCSDMTRTFFVGDDPMQDIYLTVLAANLAAIEAVKPGVRFCDIDKAARDVITAAGYGEYFTHRTGHGIGLEVHEPLDVSRSNQAIVEPGMCFSIEPGIYIPDKGGVRIEDLVLVTKDGCEVLNHYPKDDEVIL
ncbi:MAG: Xaa-Pro peptidase family protein [Erysipelotrichaceae bacterium]|jgi:Xaa-Pro dipeptidase|nr:Xaa-Pro peptidase family protein [Erysipelotrichaceae bacterium]